MKKVFCVLFLFLILISCSIKRTRSPGLSDTLGKDISNKTIEDNQNGENSKIIRVASLWIDPKDPRPEIRKGLENTDWLKNEKVLWIDGQNLDKVDFSQISMFANLEELKIKGNITRMPDLTRLERLRHVEIEGAALESLEGIGGAGMEFLYIRTYGTNKNTMLKTSDMKNMPRLVEFEFCGGKIDAKGIERFTSLTLLRLIDCEPYNLDGIGSLINLEVLALNIISPNPSMSFLGSLSNLELIGLKGNLHEGETTQVLDISPLAVSKKLWSISCSDFIIKNISALDELEIVGGIQLHGCRLYDETEKSRHALYFKYESDR